MGTNFHTAWLDGTTLFSAAEMNAPLTDLDQVISYLKNVIVHCDGAITYNKTTGQLTWGGVLRIVFNRTDGQLVENTVDIGGVTLADGQMVYVDLNETSGAVVTASVATVTTGTASTTLPYNRLVLGYRNAYSDDFFLVALTLPMTAIGSGDMVKSTYDTDDNGIVDAADTAPWSGLTDKPANVTDIAALTLTGNGNKVIGVNAGGTAFEFKTNGAGAVPSGGAAGQVLTKIDSTDFNTQWAAPAMSGGAAVRLWKCLL